MSDSHQAAQSVDTWPPLPLPDWLDTLDTLHMWTQIVGKVKLALTPFVNEWWNVGFFVTPRGLTTGSIPTGERIFSVDFDFIGHNLYIYASDGSVRTMQLTSRSVADFYFQFMDELRAMGIEVTINTRPVELPHPDPIRFDSDHDHATYDPVAVHRWWRILVQGERVLQRFRTPFYGKSSPILFYWGSFDLSHTRFSGRPTTPPAGPRFFQIAEDQENFACGFWPGNVSSYGVRLGEPAFYAYHYPEPDGCKVAQVRPAEAKYELNMGEFIFRYEDARRSASPEQAVLDFFQSTFDVVSDLAHWPRTFLEPTPHKGTQP
jgi:hypothetical protein